MNLSIITKNLAADSQIGSPYFRPDSLGVNLNKSKNPESTENFDSITRIAMLCNYICKLTSFMIEKNIFFQFIRNKCVPWLGSFKWRVSICRNFGSYVM